MAFTLEGILTSPKCFGLVKATPLQRALCRVADGLPLDDLFAPRDELAELPEPRNAKERAELAALRATHVGLRAALREDLVRAFGPGGFERLPAAQPKEFFVISGIRTAKSQICSAIAFKCAMTADVGILQPWEEAVVSVVSITLKKARIIMRHLTGPMLARPHLRSLMVREPTSQCVWLRRPHDGRIVRIEIAAGAKAGGSLVGDWSAGVLFDEFTRMTGEEDGSVINFDESRNAVLGRILPGGMLAGVGSPWAPRGAAYEIVKTRWGSPGEDLVCVRPPAFAMNPVYWTPATIEKLRKSPKGEHVYLTDFLGEFASPEASFFRAHELEAVTREGPIEAPPEEDVQYFAAMDPALRRNAWTLVIAGRKYRKDGDGSFVVVVALAKQWMPTREAPLLPGEVLEEIAADCARYRVTEVMTDGWRSNELAALGETAKITVTEFAHTAQDDVRMYDALRLRVLSASIELPPVPALMGDLLAVRKIVRSRTIAMDLPITSDGRHTDFAPSMVTVNELASNAPSWEQAMRKLRTG